MQCMKPLSHAPVFKSSQHYILTSDSNNGLFMEMCELISIFYMSYFWYCVHESCSVVVRFSYLHFKVQKTLHTIPVSHTVSHFS